MRDEPRHSSTNESGPVWAGRGVRPEVGSRERESVRWEPEAEPGPGDGQGLTVLTAAQLRDEQPAGWPSPATLSQHEAAQSHVPHINGLLPGVLGHQLGLLQHLAHVPAAHHQHGEVPHVPLVSPVAQV